MTSLLLCALLAAKGAPGHPPRTPKPAPVKRVEKIDTRPPLTEQEKRAAARERFDTWRKDPVRFVREVFGAEPDEWQKDVLRALVTEKRIALSACKGPGKSCVKAWSAWYLLALHIDAKGIACSITADNLRDNLWTELATWRSKSPLIQALFTWNAERIASTERPDTWWMSARSFPQRADKTQQANTLAGLHNQPGKVVFVILDEVGDYPDGVLPAAEGIFASKGAVARLLIGGNPTRVGGPLHTVVTRDAELWHIVHITGDPDDRKRSPRIDIDWAREQIKSLGRDHPVIMVNILGRFPPQGYDRLISVDDVTAAQKRDVPALSYLSDARIWGLDPARFGDDDSSLCRRQGVLCRRFISWNGLDGPTLASQVAKLILEAERAGEPPDAIFVDVGGVGSSAYDHLKLLGWEDIVHPVDFGSSASRHEYADKGTEMWAEMADWVSKRPACLPQDPKLPGQLTSRKIDYVYRNKRTCLAVQSKKQLRSEGIASPNEADALALTFAEPVAPTSRTHREREQGGRQTRALADYDPLASRSGDEPQARALADYNPFGRS